MKLFTGNKRWLLASFATAVLVIPQVVQAEEEAVVLDDITVKGEAISAASQPTTTNVIGSEQIRELQLLQPEKILEEVPGIEIHRYGMGGVANEFAIRGFNNGGHGGDAAVAIDGILLNEGESHADGYADMNVIIPLELDRVEVFKGPSSPLFGNFARGGAISFHTRKTGEYQTLQMIGGSYDSYDFQSVLGHAITDTLQLNTALQYASTSGYQDNSAWLRGNFSGRLAWQASPDLDLAVSARVHRSEWDAPGYIPEAQFNDEDASRHQAINAEDDGGDKSFTTQRLELGYNVNDFSRLLVWTYTTQQDFTRFAKMGYDPGGQLERFYDRRVYGVGTSYNFEIEHSGHKLSGVTGLEYLHEDTDWERYATSNRVRSSQTQDRNFIINTASLFGEVDYALHPLFQPWIGFRYDTFSGDYENRDPGATPFTSDMNDYDHLSPKIGFHSGLTNDLDFRVSYTQGFALPNDVIKYNSAAGDTASTIHQYETGVKYEPSRLFTTDLTLFRIDTTDEIQEYPSGSGDYVNLGETRRDGLEFSAVVRPGPAGLELFGDLTVLSTQITSNPDPSMNGKEITGVPDYTYNIGARYKAASGVNSRVKWRHVDKYFIDGGNTASYEGYDVTDLSIGYEGQAKAESKWRLNLDIDNLLDEHYTQAAWNGYGTNNYAVSPPRTVWLRFGLDI
ncbi:MAG: TonB-dependent receptor [Proteobacteria bacterium]|nr:TonB-dependent receptor [Pseudomonadota bacterium]MBU1641545.1 TonB-dependent receptor [Pseudomonadota bacterium]